MRLFVAVRPPTGVCEELGAATGRPVDPRWHVTLAFLGEQPGPEPLLGPLARAVSGHAPFRLRLEGGGTFGGRVLWAGIGGQVPPLVALAEDVRRELGAQEERAFHPHLTLARGRGLVVPAGLARHRGPAWPVTEVELVRSRLGRRAGHEVLSRLALRPSVSC